MTEHPGEQFPPAVDPDVEPGADPSEERQDGPDYDTEPDYDSEPGGPAFTEHPGGQSAEYGSEQTSGSPIEYAAPSATYEQAGHVWDDVADPGQTESQVSEDGAAESAQYASEQSTEGEHHRLTEHVDPVEVEFGAEFAREPGAEHEHAYEAGSVGEPSEDADVAEHVDPAEVEFGAEFAREPGAEHEHSYEAGSADPDAETEYEERDTEGGHPLVEETMARLDELRDKPVSEHGDVYADLHERLQTALVEADADQGERG
ncbi:hypothetical protein [Kribbella sp. NPDC048915]|uniref:hypothetical protein n=1 Tax=Kribbella sp. NPDC048915 TaxID=3155148 RepID=UPI0033F65846